MSNARKLGNMTTHGLDGDFNVDPTDNTLVVDSTNNRVGIGSATPTTTLDITGTATATAFVGPLTGNVTGTTSSISNHNTDALTEGSTNLYFTNARADARAQLKIDALVDSAPNTLDTLNELAAALGDDANFSTTVTNSIAAKLPLAGGSMTGALIVAAGDNGLDVRVGTDKRILFAGNIGEIGSVAGFQAVNTAGNANTAFGIRATDIRFATGSDERVRITDTGVGIGTTSPGSKLDVRGDIRLDSGGSTSRSIYFRNQDSSSTGGGQLRSDQHLSLHAGDGGGTPTQYVTIKPGGNVGIGTTNPGQKFQVYIDNSNDLEYGYRNGLIIDRLSDENMDDASASVPADRYWPQGNLKLTDGNVFNSDSNGPGLSFYKHRDNSGNEYVQAFIGTRGVFGSNNTDLRFYVNSANAANLLPTSPQMLISGANGNVGINHDAPRSKLHVTSNNSGFVTSNGVGIEGIQVTRNTGTHGENMYMYTSSGVGWSGNQYIGRVESFGNNTMEIGTTQNLTKAISFGTNNTERMVIEGAGNVGINKSDPSATLDIANSDVSQTTLNVSPPGSGDAHVVLINRGYGSHKGSGLKIAGANYTNGTNSNAGMIELDAGSYSGSGTRFIHAYDNSGTDFVVQGDGRVGIGMSSPDAPLHVNGAAIIGGNNNQSTSPIAGLHVLDSAYSGWSTTLSKQQVALRVETLWNSSNGTRAVGAYGGGIGFNHLGGHSAQHDENVHAWIGPRVVSTPGHETSALAFATNNDTSDEDAGILERASISPEGRFTFKQYSTNASQIHNSVGYTDLYKFSFSMNMIGNQAYVVRTSGHGNGILRIMAQGSHWSSPYGLWRESYLMLDNSSTMSESNMHNQTSSQQGSWSFSRHSATEVDIVKAAGTYAGGMLTNIIIYSPRIVNVVGVY